MVSTAHAAEVPSNAPPRSGAVLPPPLPLASGPLAADLSKARFALDITVIDALRGPEQQLSGGIAGSNTELLV